MAKNRNCPNCGAPYETHLSKCPYCGTSYFDMSALDFNERKPFYLKTRYGNMTVTQLVRPRLDESGFELSSDTVEASDFQCGITKYVRGYSMKTNLSFEAVMDDNGHLCEIYQEVKE